MPIPQRLIRTRVVGPCWLRAAGWPAVGPAGWDCRRAPVPSPAGRTGGLGARRSWHPSGRTVRLSEFWTRMRAQFGDAYATSVAKDHVLAALGERTVDQALADGVDAKTVWRAVCAEFDVPQRLR